MAVSFLDGKYVKQMTASLENIDDALNALNETLSSSEEPNALESISDNILLDRNIVPNLIWDADLENQRQINSNIFSITRNKEYAMLTIMSDEVNPEYYQYIKVKINIYDSAVANPVFYKNYSYTNLSSDIIKIDEISLGNYMSVSVFIDNSTDLDINPNDFINTLFISEIVSDTPLSDVEKAYIHKKLNINNAGNNSENINDYSDNILLERNKATELSWSNKNIDDEPYIVSSSIAVSRNKWYTLFISKKDNFLSNKIVKILLYNSNDTLLETTTKTFSNFYNIFTWKITRYGASYIRIAFQYDDTMTQVRYYQNLFVSEVISSALTEIEKEYIRRKIEVNNIKGFIRYDVDQTTGNGALTSTQQEQARANIGLNNIDSLINGVIRYDTDQTTGDDALTSTQQEQARANIGLDNIDSLINGVIRYDTDQTTGDDALTSEQQEQARANIGLDDIDSLVTGTVKYSIQQNLQPGEKSQALDNIGAASASTVRDIQIAIAGMDKNVTNVIATNDGTGLIIEYADNTTSEPITIASGQTIGSIYYDEEYKLHILDEDGVDIVDPIVIYGGGGGSVIDVGSASITQITPLRVSYRYQQPAPISFTFTAVDSDNEPVGNGRGTWIVDGVTVATNVIIRQGTNEYDISRYLNAGENTVRLSVAVNIGGEKDKIVNKTWTVTAVDMRFEWNYNDVQINTEAFTDSCVVYGGNILKTIHTIIDEGTENEIVLDNVSTTRTNSTQMIEIPKLSHGAHGVKRWLTATIGSQEESTPVQYHEMVFVQDENITPIIAVSSNNVTVQQYDTVRIPIYVYNPSSLTSTVDYYVDNVKVSTQNDKDRSIDYWTYTPSAIGNGTVLEYAEEENDSGETVQVPSKWQNILKVVCRYIIPGENDGLSQNATVEKEIPITVTRLKLDAVEVPGYEFKFKTSDFVNNDDVINWSYTTPSGSNITAAFSNNFDWVNGGLHTETVDENLNETDGEGSIQQYLSIKAGTTMTLNYKPFANDVKENGMTFKIIFKVKNCRKYNAKFAQCYDSTSGVGIQLFAHNATFSSSGQSINMQYDEDQYTELEFDVYPTDAVGDPHYPRYMMGWLDGVVSICRVYETTDIFVQNNANKSNIIIGSQDCDVNVYLVKVYNSLINHSSNFDNHISNFIMDAPNGQQMLKRFNRNDILDDNGDISYVKLANRNQDLRVWLYNIPYMTNGKKDKVNASFEQIWSNGSNYYQMHGEGKISIQGTSSVGYARGAANTDIDFTSLHDGNGNDLLENGTQDSRYGNNWYYQDSVNTNQAKQFTVLDAKINAGIRRAYTPVQAMSIAQVNDASLLGNEWEVYETDGNDVPTLYINTSDTDAEGKTLGSEWVVIERDASRNPTKYIKALGMKLNDDSCPITYSNTKVNFASCEQVNNMCNAAWYQRFNPYPSLTARDCMEFNMGVQFIKDGAQGDSDHFTLFDNTTKYNMYSIANMGTSKKNVHIFHDLSNSTEVCIEVKDNTEPQMRMISADMSLQDWADSDKNKKCYYEMRYPDAKDPDQINPQIKSKWYEFVTWMANSNPYAATNAQLDNPVEYGDYTFNSTYHDRPGKPVLAGLKISRYSGIYTTDSFEYRMAKMLSECEDHMVMDSFVYHYVYLTRHTMVDNVSKNNFWSSTDLEHWDLSKAYDMDTSDGNDNQGKLVFDYGLEYDDDRAGTQQKVFNGSDSVWFRFIANLPEACEAMFQDRELVGAWSASDYHNFLTEEQHKVPERCWNQTYWYDYLRTHEDASLDALDINVSDWIQFLDGGQKIHQRKHYETFQEIFLSSKYHGNVSKNQQIRLYSYAPSVWGGIISSSSGVAQLRQSAAISSTLIAQISNGEKIKVGAAETASNGVVWRNVTYGNYSGYIQESQIESIYPKGEISVTMYNKMYVYIDNGTVALPSVKVDADVPYTFTFDSGALSNAIIAVNGASMITKLTGIEQLYCNNITLGSAYRLREVSIGSTEKGYYNDNLTVQIQFGGNRMLERIEAQNLTKISAPLSLIGCPVLSYLDTTGSGFTNYEFADGGNLKTAIIQSPVTLSMKNLDHLNTLTILDYSKLIGLIIDNCANIDEPDIINQAIALAYVRLLGVNWPASTTEFLRKLYAMGGYDERNITIAQSVLGGYAHVPTIRRRYIDQFETVWPDLELDLTNSMIVDEFPVHFVDHDGTPLLDINGDEYVQYVGAGEDAYDPIEAEEIEEPQSFTDEKYHYVFRGWDNLPVEVAAETTVTAEYDTTDRVYTINWYLDSSETTLLKSITTTYGSEVVYDSENENNYPTKTSEERYGIYNVFKGWDNSTGFIKEDPITGDIINVHGRWDRAQLPGVGEKELNQYPSTLSIAEIYGIAKSGRANEFWSDSDYVDIKLGRDFDFNNVQSTVLLQDRYFNGTGNIVRFNNIKLFDENAPSFTLVIDYEFTDITSNAVLAACSDDYGVDGFKLEYYKNSANDHGSRIVWGDKRTIINGGTNRSIIALRHRKGSKNLYMCADNNGEFVNLYSGYVGNSEVNSSVRPISYKANALSIESPRTQETQTSAVLSFGGVAVGSQGQSNAAKGWIHFAKIWYDDLGYTTVRQLASWPHETLRMHYRGKDLYTLSDGTGLKTNASFISNSSLSQLYNMYPVLNNSNSTPNNGGWTSSVLRTFLNSRFYNAFPIEWISIIQKVRVSTVPGYDQRNGPPLITDDYIVVPGMVDVISIDDVQNSSDIITEGSTISWYRENKDRVKFMGLIIPQNSKCYTTSDDPTLLVETESVKNGDIWLNNNLYYIYVNEDTKNKHYILGGREITNAANIVASGPSGGIWIRAYIYWLRTPYKSSESYNYAVSPYGEVSYFYSYSNGGYRKAIVPQFSI